MGLATLRLLLRFAWLYLALLVLSRHTGALPALPIVRLFLAVIVAQVALLFTMLRLEQRHERPVPARVCICLALALLAATVVQAGFVDGAFAMNGWLFVLDVALGVMVFWSPVSLAAGRPAYGEVLAGSIRGGFWMLLSGLAVVVYTSGGVSDVRVPGLLYPALLAYAVVAILTLALARRFCPDDQAPDRRPSRAEPEWIISAAGISGSLAVLGFILPHLPLFNGAPGLGPVASLLQYPGAAVGRASLSVVLRVGTKALTAFPSLWRLLVRYIPGNMPLPHTRPDPTLYDQNLILQYSRTAPPAVRLAIRHAIAHRAARSGAARHGGIVHTLLAWVPIPHSVAAVTALVLGVLAAPLAWWLMQRRVMGSVPHGTGSRQRRFARVRRGLASSAGLFTRRGQEQEATSVRSVYRSFLKLARRRARARIMDETALEYSAGVAARWPAAGSPLDRLNALYMVTRYGLTTDSPDLGQAAAEAFRAIAEVIDGTGSAEG